MNGRTAEQHPGGGKQEQKHSHALLQVEEIIHAEVVGEGKRGQVFGGGTAVDASVGKSPNAGAEGRNGHDIASAVQTDTQTDFVFYQQNELKNNVH